MKSKKFILKFILFFLFSAITYGQDSTKSLAFKANKPKKATHIFYQPDLSYQIWKQWRLIQEANSGDPLAQQELGLRYLLGEEFPADTLKGAYWIKKAADQDLAAAKYNYGILLNNGWGVRWNPFEAFNYFLEAADEGMAQAQYIVGLFYTDDLVVKRDFIKAYEWIKKSAESGFEPANNILPDIIKRVPKDYLDDNSDKDNSYSSSSYQADNSLAASLGLVYIDFASLSDSTKKITDNDLFEDLKKPGNTELEKFIKVNKSDSVINADSISIPTLIKFAEAGSPEALTMLGKFYEKGQFVEKDIIKALSYYLRATMLDSPTAPILIYNYLKEHSVPAELNLRAKKGEPVAQFVWYCLNKTGFDNSIHPKDAFNLLLKSAKQKYIPALVELGLDYFTGRSGEKNKIKALKAWTEAQNLGSVEAKVRIATAIIFDEIKLSSYQEAVKFLIDAANNGSVLAQAALAYSFEEGIGTKQNVTEAVKYYRYAAQRGSRYAFTELKRLYDEIRPENSVFNLN